MVKMIQIRHVPDRVHKTLKLRAARADKRLSDYLREELECVAAQLTADELADRLSRLERVDLMESPSASVRAKRESR
ncbi:MAG: hypothetical protein IPN34_24245 [Planctomycetes bacterium]|nr:hypothetical protein [Planctomycetota bacterium]